MRTEILKDINGGVGLLIKTLLEKAFFDKEATDMSAAGVHVKLIDGTVILVFVKLEIVFGDEAALHYVYACKGASGLKPCLVCINVFDHKNQRDVIARDRTGKAVTHTCVDETKLQLHTPETLKAVVQRLAAQFLVLGKG